MDHVCPECGELHEGAGYCVNDGAVLASRRDDALLGTTVGSWRIARLLGAGGMGRVYKAVQPSIGGRVAVKVLSRECSEERELVDRFFAEARAVNLIRHENIVDVLDLAFLPDGRPYIVMEYLDGQPLSSLIRRRGPLPLGGLARLVGEVLDAVGAAHAKGIVHRDLKPDNIFVSPNGHARVLDFGIAKLAPELDSRRLPTVTGALLGTPGYMAPEQAQGRKVDARADLYAMGVVLYEGATGAAPFTAGSLFELLRKVIEEPPPAPRARRGELPPAYEAVVLRALAKDPAARFAGAAEMAQALAQAARGLDDAPLTAESAPSAQVATPPSDVSHDALPPTRASIVRRRPAILAAGAVAVAAVAVAALAFTRGESPPRQAAAPPSAAPVADAAPPLPAAPDATPPARRPGGGDATPVPAGLPSASPDYHHVPLDNLPTPDDFDLSKFLPVAQKLARKVMDDAELTNVRAGAVRPDGHLDLTAGGWVQLIFRSPSRSKPAAAPGAQRKCLVMVSINNMGFTASAYPSACDEVIVGLPRCSVAAAWQKAAAPDRAGEVVYGWDGDANARSWKITAAASVVVADDCTR